MTTGETVNAIVNGFVAFGTILLAVLAIYGEWIRSRLLGPKLKLVLDNPKGMLYPSGDRIYSLLVTNERPSAIAMNCQVHLKRLWRRMPNGEYREIQLPHPLVMSWPPSEYTPMSITMRRENRVDFGSLQSGKCFRPGVRVYPSNFDGVVKAGGAMRYGLEIVSDHFVSSNLQLFDVAWKGEWNEDDEKMLKNLQIREVTDERKAAV